jgi:alkylation response protein AidB-like acyl-CoA dehydrogenase
MNSASKFGRREWVVSPLEQEIGRDGKADGELDAILDGVGADQATWTDPDTKSDADRDSHFENVHFAEAAKFDLLFIFVGRGNAGRSSLFRVSPGGRILNRYSDMLIQQGVKHAGNRLMLDRRAIAPVPIAPHILDTISERFGATASAYDRSAEFPSANFDILASEGLIGLTVSPQFGGRGAGLQEALRVLGAVAKGEPSTALILFMTYGFHALPAHAQRLAAPIYERLARQAVEGRGLIGTLRVEPDLGTPVRGGWPKTTARRRANGWVITGDKIYATGSTGLTWFLVWAKTDEDQPRVGNFLVEAKNPGIKIEPTWDHLGMRATVSHQVVFEDTPIPLDYADIRTPEEWALGAGNESWILWNALAISTIYDAIARSAQDWLRDYLKSRTPSNLGGPLASLARVQEKFGEIETLLQVNRTLIQTAVRADDESDRANALNANTVKYVVTSNAIRAVQIGLELTGNPGISRRNPLERHYRDVLCSRIHSPQDDSILVASGRSALGLK